MFIILYFEHRLFYVVKSCNWKFDKPHSIISNVFFLLTLLQVYKLQSFIKYGHQDEIKTYFEDFPPIHNLSLWCACAKISYRWVCSTNCWSNMVLVDKTFDRTYFDNIFVSSTNCRLICNIRISSLLSILPITILV
jgi:hypothetical protein